MVTATRHGRKKDFTVALWESMPAHKYGWAILPVETPKEIQAPEEMPERVTLTKKKRHAES